VRIGNVVVDPPLILAPMARITNWPFRLLCRRAGAGLVTSELISANALHFGSTKTHVLLRCYPEEQPLAVQIFGADPTLMADAAQVAVEAGAAIVDLNMGCPVPKVRRAGAGSALLANHPLAAQICARVAAAVSVPVTAKIRAGLRVGDDSYLELGRRLADSGATAITLHARSANQGYRSLARWDTIARLVAAVEVPVIGNGDVAAPGDPARLMAETGCVAAMVGRAALGRPGILAQMAANLRGEELPPWPRRFLLAVAILHAQMLVEYLGEFRAVREMRAQAVYYTRGLPGSARVRERLVHATTLAEMSGILRELIAALPGEGEPLAFSPA